MIVFCHLGIGQGLTQNGKISVYHGRLNDLIAVSRQALVIFEGCYFGHSDPKSRGVDDNAQHIKCPAVRRFPLLTFLHIVHHFTIKRIMSSSKIVLITGANTGLGFETVKAMYHCNIAYTIILSGRSLERVRAAVEELQSTQGNSKNTIEALQLDVTNDESINAAFDFVYRRYGKLDALINNAGEKTSFEFPRQGILILLHLGSCFDPLFLAGKVPLRQMMNDTWNVNVTSAHVLTYTFIPLLVAAKTDSETAGTPRIIFLTSGLSTLSSRDENIAANASPVAGWPKRASPSLGMVAYPSSKTGHVILHKSKTSMLIRCFSLNMLMLQWQRILKNDGVKVFAISPGFLATGLGGDKEFLKKAGAGDPADGARIVLSVVEGARDNDEGTVVWADGKVQPW